MVYWEFISHVATSETAIRLGKFRHIRSYWWDVSYNSVFDWYRKWSHVRYVRTAGGPSVTALVTLVQQLSRDLSAPVCSSIINWIEQWLTDRRQRVVVDGEVSNWKSVLSGVPQGSVLGPILFLVYINDLEEGVIGKILKFANDTKLFTKTKEIGDKQNLQDDIDKLVKWSEKWQMLFNFGKCKCLHIGPGNTSMTYEMGGTILSTTVKKKDLGVTMNANMKVSEQCRIAASKGNQVLGMIRRNISYKDKSLIVPLYKAIVIPHLEYCIQAWNPISGKT